MPSMEPIYLKTLRTGALKKTAEAARKRLLACTMCPRRCKVNRRDGDVGVCRTGAQAKIASFNAHFGEEAPLVGRNGSGTIFFTHCNLLCLFCQNYDISHQGVGQEVSDDELAGIMLHLQRVGCHNINFVTPSHVVPQMLSALVIAAEKGLHIPLVYNSSGYDAVETLALLDGVVDIYMPDVKFLDSEIARKACDAPDYPQVVQAALLEMHRQVGDLTLDADGIARRGLLVRHLVLPGGLAGTPAVMAFIAERLSTRTYVNVMFQYRPCGRAGEIPELRPKPSKKDFDAAVAAARKAGLTRLDKPRRVFLL
jgi:putative pyruvate formate lyase activating enzyme